MGGSFAAARAGVLKDGLSMRRRVPAFLVFQPANTWGWINPLNLRTSLHAALWCLI
jgi:hypothetical protein